MLIAQITDTHLPEKNHHWLAEPATDTASRLSKVVSFINTLRPLPDLIILSGDCTDHGTPASYDHLHELLAPLKIPLYVLPGNHDNREEMRKAFAYTPYMPKKGFINYTIETWPVRIICLDTMDEGKESGLLCKERVEWLERVLKMDDKPSLIFMHHPLAMTGFKLVDSVRCFSTHDLEPLIKDAANLLGINAGHYHRTSITSFGGKPCFLAPSVAPVFYFDHPNDNDPSTLELDDPSVTLHHWTLDGGLISHVFPVKEQDRRLSWKKIKKS